MAVVGNEQQKETKAGEQTLLQLVARLRILRLAGGMTQEKFSEAAGLSYKYYQAVEAGRKRELRLSTLERLARAHKLEVWELLKPSARGPGRISRRSTGKKIH